MSDADLQKIYVLNLGNSLSAAIRGVWDSGYAAGAAESVATATTTDPAATESEATAASLTPTTILPN